jgi:hypothetical protein
MWIVERAIGWPYLGAYDWRPVQREAVRFASRAAAKDAAAVAAKSNSGVRVVRLVPRSGGDDPGNGDNVW